MFQKLRLNKIMLPLANQDDTAAMRSFALTMSIAFPSVFMLVLPWFFNTLIPVWPAFISAILMILHVLKPSAIYYPYRVWMVIASVFGWVNTNLILGLVFFLVITPMGVVMKLLGKLQYKNKVVAKSNWVKPENSPASKDKKRLEEPF